MPQTPNLALPYPAASDAPDGAGAVYSLATAIDTALGTTTTGTWSPGIGGTGATQGGASSGSVGYWRRQGRMYLFIGTIIFGSGASWGSGTTIVTNLPVSVDTGLANGTGWYSPSGGGALQQVFFYAASATTLYIKQPVAGSSQNFGGSIAAGDRLTFRVDAVTA